MKRYIRSNTDDIITKDSVLNALHAAGIDTTVATYELSQEMYARFSEAARTVCTFKAPGDWMAVLGMRLHGDLSIEHLEEWFGTSEEFEEEVQAHPTVDSLLRRMLMGEEEYRTHYLKNVTTGEVIYGKASDDVINIENEW